MPRINKWISINRNTGTGNGCWNLTLINAMWCILDIPWIRATYSAKEIIVWRPKQWTMRRTSALLSPTTWRWKDNTDRQPEGQVGYWGCYLDATSFNILYKAFIRPHLEYNIQVCIWSPHLNKDIQILKNVQRRATEVVYTVRKLPYLERLRLRHSPTLEKKEKSRSHRDI